MQVTWKFPTKALFTNFINTNLMKSLLMFTSVLLVIASIVVSCSKDKLLTNSENVENQELIEYL
jgi:hypothetical protein